MYFTDGGSLGPTVGGSYHPLGSTPLRRGTPMKVQRSIRVAVATAAVLAMLDASASVVEKSMRAGGFDVQYKVILPNGYDAAKDYTAVLVMGGGPPTMNTVDGTLERNFRAEAEARGYIVVAPAAPNGELFF